MVLGQESTYFTWVNRGKESLVANIKDKRDHALLHRILARADVFVQNLAPGASSRAGFDSTELRRLYPQLITMDISGYGETGPKAHFKAYDLLVQAESALCTVSGIPGTPMRVGVSVCDIICGLNAHAAILQALLDRANTGVGQGLKTSLFAGAAELMTVPYLQELHTGAPPVNIGLAHPAIAPYGVFGTKDGGKILLGIQNEREWRKLCTSLLADEVLADDPRFSRPEQRVANRALLDAKLTTAAAEYTQPELLDLLVTAGVACAAVNSVKQLLHHPQLHTVRYQSPAGEVKLPAPPVTSSVNHYHPPALGPVPSIGHHSAAIRGEFPDASHTEQGRFQSKQEEVTG